jgi:hypothetical protein
MKARQLRRQRQTRMGWLVKRPTYLRGAHQKGCSRPYVWFVPAYGPAENWAPKRRIEQRRERERRRRPIRLLSPLPGWIAEARIRQAK